MTSARHRGFIDGQNSEGITFSHSYQQWKRPQQMAALNSAINSNYINDPFKPKQNQPQPLGNNMYFNNFING